MRSIAKALWEIRNQQLGMNTGTMYFVLCLTLSVFFENIPMQLQLGMLLSISGLLILKLRRFW